MSSKVTDLIGLKGWNAYSVFQRLMIGVKMLPFYDQMSYEEFYNYLDELPPQEQLKYIKQALLLVKMEGSEVLTLIECCSDPNGIAYGEAHLKSMPLDKMFDLMVEACVELSKIKINFISEDEKKKLRRFPSTSGES